MLVGPQGRAAATLLPGVDAIAVHRAPWIDPEPEPVSRADTLALVERLAALGIDQAVILTSFHQSPLPLALLLRLAQVPVVAATSEDYPGSLLDVRHRIPDDVHEVERSLSLVATLGFRLPPEDDGRLAVKRTGTLPAACAAAQGYVVVHPGASVPARAWGPRRSSALARALVAAGRRVVVTGGPGERALTESVARDAGGNVVDLGGQTDFAALAEVLAAADVVVVGNTGPAHLAASVGTPVVSLFAPTVPAVRWRPWGRHILLGDQAIACAGCRARTCPVPGHPCLEAVPVEQVVAAVETLAGREAVPDNRVPHPQPPLTGTATRRAAGGSTVEIFGTSA
jgi:ADP-heptose:LPS heptosyltransferase